VSHPLAIACFGGGSDTASVNIGKALCEAGIPAAPAFGVISGNVSYIFHRDAKACGADHRAVGTRQATAGHVVPARMLKVLVEKLFDASGIDATHLLARCAALGGEVVITDNDKREMDRFTMREAGECYVFDDDRVWHMLSPVEISEDSQFAFRDTVTFDLLPEGWKPS